MNRCLLVATDGSPAARAALLYALDFASALRADEIACLSVYEDDRAGDFAAAAVVAAGELALANGSPGPMRFELPDGQLRLPMQPEAVLDVCRDQVTAAGFQFTPVIGSSVPNQVIATTAHLGELIFLGCNSDATPAVAPRMGSTVSATLQSVQQTVVVCPATYAPVDRIVLLMAGDLRDAELVARGATWAAALNVPTLIAVADSGRRFSHNARRTAERVVNETGVQATGTMYAGRPVEFARKLGPTDLILITRHRRWGLVHRWFGNVTDRIVEHAAGPVAVVPNP